MEAEPDVVNRNQGADMGSGYGERIRGGDTGSAYGERIWGVDTGGGYGACQPPAGARDTLGADGLSEL